MDEGVYFFRHNSIYVMTTGLNPDAQVLIEESHKTSPGFIIVSLDKKAFVRKDCCCLRMYMLTIS